ncbi:MAG: acetyl-CoA hydrolase/transferase C-terminal domain-containing protein [Chloroflexota bacterium]|nr:acetyl-CoA hydrolase/transferase C-terminal domain-containing protein [Chloroflexota bacterium]
MDWREEYKSKLVSAEDAVKVVKSGDRVVIPLPAQPRLLPHALAARKDELRNVEIQASAPTQNPGWYSLGMEESFIPTIELFIAGIARSSHDEKICTYLPDLFSLRFKGIDERRPESQDKQVDVFMTVVSPPNRHGFVSLGASLWHKRSYIKRAGCVIAEVDENQVWTYGTSAVHVSEIDYFVQHTPFQPTKEQIAEVVAGVPEEVRGLAEYMFSQVEPEYYSMLFEMVPILDAAGVRRVHGMLTPEPDEAAHGIAENLKYVLKDGDTFNIGVGRPSRFMVELGVFDGFHDMGIHTEMGARGMGMLVKKGVASGRRKTLHPEVAVFSTFMGCSTEDIEYMAENPLFQQLDTEYVNNIPVVARNENMVAINNGLQVDLTGQICSETQFGPRMINGQGGQPEMHVGAMLAKGGRGVTLLPSMAVGGMSTIVGQLEKGSLVTIPRQLADTVVTEHGVARLLDKNHRQRAEELIAVAHPDHRAELRKEAQRLFWPG